MTPLSCKQVYPELKETELAAIFECQKGDGFWELSDLTLVHLNVGVVTAVLINAGAKSLGEREREGEGEGEGERGGERGRGRGRGREGEEEGEGEGEKTNPLVGIGALLHHQHLP